MWIDHGLLAVTLRISDGPDCSDRYSILTGKYINFLELWIDLKLFHNESDYSFHYGHDINELKSIAYFELMISLTTQSCFLIQNHNHQLQSKTLLIKMEKGGDKYIIDWLA